MQKFITCCLLFFVLCIESLPAQPVEENKIADLVEALRKAMLSPAKSVLESFAADKLSYGHSTGLIEDKAAFVDDLISGKTGFTSLDLSDQTINIAGDVAIVRNRFIAELKDAAKTKIDLIVLMIWQKQNGQWKLLARQAAKIRETQN